jgi:HEAT repeat protein
MKSAAILWILVSGCLFAADDESTFVIPETDIPARIAKIGRMSDDERTMLLHELSYERQKIFEALIVRLDSPRLETKLHAAYLLGMFRMEHAAPHLARYIRLTDDKIEERGDDLWFWNRYPAADALVSIGLPSVPYLIDNLAESDDELIRKLSLDAIIAIEGERFTKIVLVEALDKPRSNSQHKRLLAAFETLIPVAMNQ